MGAVMCDSRLQAILLFCAAVSVSAELLVEDPDGEDGKIDVQRGQMEPVMAEVQRPSREEPRVEGRMVKTMTSPIQVWAAVWDGLKGKLAAPPRPEVVNVNAPPMDSWKLNFRLKRGDIQRIFPSYGPQYGYHLRKRSRGSDPNDWIRLLKKQADAEADSEGVFPMIPQVLRLGKRSQSWSRLGARGEVITPGRTDPYWLSWWKGEPKWEDNFQAWRKTMMTQSMSEEARKKDMHKVLKAFGAMLSEGEE